MHLFLVMNLVKMTWLGISPYSFSIIAVIDDYFKAGQSVEAISILNIFNPPLNIFLCNGFISKLCTDGNMVNASRVFYEMSGKGLLSYCFSYTTIIAGYFKARDMNKAFQYVGKMLKVAWNVM